MKEQNKTKAQLIQELTELRSKINELEKSKTKTKQLDNVNQESEEKFKDIFESVSDGLIYLDRTGKILDVNKKAVQIYGGPKKELLGKHFTKLGVISFKDVPLLLRKFTNAIKGKATGFELSIKNRKGKKIILQCSAALSKKGTQIIGIIVIARDITERKRIEEALKESHKRFKDIFENTTIGLYRTTPDGRIIMANPTLFKMLGYSSFKELASRNLEENGYFPEYPRSDFKKQIKNEGQVIGLESAWIKKDGTKLFIRENATGICDDAGNILYYEGTVEDITEHKIAEKALRESEEKYRNLVENSQDAIAIIDLKGNVLFANKQAGNLTGYTLEEGIGMNLRKITPIKYWKRNASLIRRAVNGEQIPYFESVIKRKDGKLVLVESGGQAIFQDGKALAIQIITRDITERKKAKETRKESEEKYREMIELAPDGILTSDLKGVITSCNTALSKQTGYPLDRFINKHFTKIPTVRAIDIPKYSKVLYSLIRGKSPRVFEYKWVHKNGTTRTGELYISLRKKEGKLIGFQIITRDITERKKAEKALKESEKRFRELWNNAPVAYHILNTKGIITSVNKTEAKMLGYNPEEMTGKSIFEFVLPEQRAAARKRFQQKISGKHVSRADNRIYVKKDGSQIYVEIDDFLERNSKGKIVGIRSTMVDITERKKEGEKLQVSEERYRAIFEHAADSIVLIDGETGTLVEFNDKAHENLGYTRNEFEKLKIPDFEITESPEEVKNHIKKIIKERSDSFETKHKTKEAKIRDIHVTSRAIVIRGKNFIQSIWRDITERKKAEEEIKNSREELRNLAAHLQSAREEERTLIAREIHDELGQALTALKMDLSLLTSKLPKYQKPLLSRTKSMTNLLDETIQTVKKLYTELRPAMLDDLGLAAAIEWQTEEFQSRTGIKCEVKIEPKEPVLDKKSSTAIFRIFQEALTNVARHTDASEVKVNLSEKAKSLELRVRDNGEGIAGEKIHDPQSYGLIGIRERAQFLGGEVKIIGVQNRGTTIAVSIPLHKNGGIQ